VDLTRRQRLERRKAQQLRQRVHASVLEELVARLVDLGG
jgi:hypothetical protein